VSFSYDALLVVSFGGPEGPADVLPFLENVTRGRAVPAERLREAAEHYRHFGGVSPINEQNRALVAAVREEFGRHELDLPLFWGNRNWSPYLTDAIREMAHHGVRRALAFVTSAYASYPACRQYQEDIAGARAAVGPAAPAVDKLRHYFNHPGFIEPNADAVRAALATLHPRVRRHLRLVFTAHSIPVLTAARSGPAGGLYVRQLREAAALVAAAGAPELPWDLVWQSRSGAPTTAWLEPDVNDYLREAAAGGATAVVVSPIGFVSDHLEVCWDLDHEAAGTAARMGLAFARAGTAGADPRFVTMIRDLVIERLAPPGRRAALGSLGASHDVCPANCCLGPDAPPSGQTTRG